MYSTGPMLLTRDPSSAMSLKCIYCEGLGIRLTCTKQAISLRVIRAISRNLNTNKFLD